MVLNDNPSDHFDGKDMEKIRPVKRCPKCGNLSLEYDKMELRCSRCGFKQPILR
jgi:ribosomal protein L37E